MGSETATTSVCDHCGERRPANSFVESGTDGHYCLNCIQKKNCDSCGQEVFVLENSTDQDSVFCSTCLDESEAQNYTDRVASFLKAAAIGIIGILVSVGVRVFDEIVVLLLRTLDGGISLLRTVVEEITIFRPVLAPIVSLYQEWIAIDIAMAFLVVGIFIIALESRFFGGARLFNVLTFPGTIVHEWAHKTMCEWYGLQVTDVEYFQLESPLGFVEWRGTSTFGQTIGISVAPLLFNTIVAVLIAVSATFFQEHLKLWGLIVTYWLAFSIGTRALPSHGDIDNIWIRIRNEWRENRIVLFAVPLVLVLRLARMLRVAYLGAIYGALTVIAGRFLVYLVG